MAESNNVYIRHVRPQDRREFLALMCASKALHMPWITPPLNQATFAQYIARTNREDHEGFVVARYSDDAIVGVVNLNNIVRGSFLSASLGYYVGAPYLGQGYMLDGLNLVKNHAFTALQLHRLEANIQPTNERSLKLVQRAGFVREGIAPAFLFLDGAWRDHERWSCVDQRETMLLPPTQPTGTKP